MHQLIGKFATLGRAFVQVVMPVGNEQRQAGQLFAAAFQSIGSTTLPSALSASGGIGFSGFSDQPQDASLHCKMVTRWLYNTNTLLYTPRA